MEQLELCKRVLKLPNFAEVKIKGYGYVGSVELIMLACLLSLVWSTIVRSINPNYVIIGVALPLLLSYKGVNIVNYW
jgi:hypothetical protein